MEPSSSHEPETVKNCIDVITAEHLHAADGRRRAFAIFAITRAEEHRLLRRIAAAAAAGFLVRSYHFIVSATCCCTVSLPAEEFELPPSQEPEYRRVLHRITAAAADHVYLLFYGSFLSDVEPLPSKESDTIEHRTKEGY